MTNYYLARKIRRKKKNCRILGKLRGLQGLKSEQHGIILMKLKVTLTAL